MSLFNQVGTVLLPKPIAPKTPFELPKRTYAPPDVVLLTKRPLFQAELSTFVSARNVLVPLIVSALAKPTFPFNAVSTFVPSEVNTIFACVFGYKLLPSLSLIRIFLSAIIFPHKSNRNVL